jgi:hypothetical protein
MSSTRRTLTPAKYNQSFFDRRLAPPVALDNRRLEGQVAQLRNRQRHFTSLGL